MFNTKFVTLYLGNFLLATEYLKYMTTKTAAIKIIYMRSETAWKLRVIKFGNILEHILQTTFTK